MAIDSQLQTTNISWGRPTSGGSTYQYASGLYNYCWVNKVGWTTSNYSGCQFMKRTVSPYVWATTTSTTNFSISSLIRSKDYKFYFNILSADALKTDVRFTSPFSYSYSDTQKGSQCTVLSADQTYIGIQCNTVYGFTFGGWRVNSASGTVVSLSESYNFFYSNSNMSGTTNLYATAI